MFVFIPGSVPPVRETFRTDPPDGSISPGTYIMFLQGFDESFTYTQMEVSYKNVLVICTKSSRCLRILMDVPFHLFFWLNFCAGFKKILFSCFEIEECPMNLICSDREIG